MLKKFAKVIAVTAASAVAIPYTTAFVIQALYGWPHSKKQLLRAFSPSKVYALNYSVIQQMMLVKYASLYLAWRKFYSQASRRILIKDLPYGSHDNRIDIHFPDKVIPDGVSPPVIIYVYGGSWSSGDKSTYGLLCNHLANQLGAIVCCPNYTLYPKGYVDDMVQDIVDCITWIHEHQEIHGGDKDRIMILGHSAGAHLVMLSVLELAMKRLIQDPTSMILPAGQTPDQPPPILVESMLQFEESHFDGSENSGNGLDVSNSESFYVFDKNTVENVEADLDKEKSAPPSHAGLESENNEKDSFLVVEKSDNDLQTEPNETVSTGDDKEEVKKSESVADEGEVPVKLGASGDSDAKQAEAMKKADVEDVFMTDSQRGIRDIFNSIKCIVGLAGVYDIQDHYEHECLRGVEDLSAMDPAMYGPESFSRFSPTLLTASLEKRTRLPPVTLIHPTNDHVVPQYSSDKFAHALKMLGSCSVNQYNIPGCSHYEVVLDMMDPDRPFHDLLFAILHGQVTKFLK